MADALNAVGRAAVGFARHGIPVFPCHPGWGGQKGKQPLIEDGFKVASARVDQVTQWWFRWTDALIGVVPGAAGAVVVDLDPAPGEKPLDVLRRLSEVAGETIPADGAAVVTQSGGVHLWFARPEVPQGTVIGNRKPCRGVDFRADNGYVIAPPSRMASGRKYTWAVPWQPGQPLPALPEGLRVLFLREDEPAVPAPVPGPTGPVPARVRTAAAVGDSRLRRYVEAALDGAHGDVARAGKGQRNDALNRAAYSLGQLVGAGAIAESEVRQVLGRAAEISGLVADDGVKAVEATIGSGLRGGMAACGRAAAKVAEIVRGRDVRVGGAGSGAGHDAPVAPTERRQTGIRDAGKLWRAGWPVPATPAATALRRFGIDPDSVDARFLGPESGAQGTRGDLMFPVRDGRGGGIGVVTLKADGDGDVRCIGAPDGGTVRIRAAERELLLAGDVLQALAVASVLNRACWALPGCGDRVSVRLPDVVRRLIIVHGGEIDAAELARIGSAHAGFGRQVGEMVIPGLRDMANRMRRRGL